MAGASAVPTLLIAAFAVLTVMGVAALTVTVELSAQRFEKLKKSLSRLGAGLGEPGNLSQADNGWLTAVVRSFDD